MCALGIPIAANIQPSMHRMRLLKKKKLLFSTSTKGFIPQKGFTKGMEQLLGTHESQLRESLKEVVPQVGKPRFKMVPEEVKFSPEDAAAALGRTSHALIQEHAMQAETYRAFVLEGGGSQKKWEVIGKNPREGNKRFKFLIRDTGRKKAEKLEEGEGLEEIVRKKVRFPYCFLFLLCFFLPILCARRLLCLHLFSLSLS